MSKTFAIPALLFVFLTSCTKNTKLPEPPVPVKDSLCIPELTLYLSCGYRADVLDTTTQHPEFYYASAEFVERTKLFEQVPGGDVSLNGLGLNAHYFPGNRFVAQQYYYSNAIDPLAFELEYTTITINPTGGNTWNITGYVDTAKKYSVSPLTFTDNRPLPDTFGVPTAIPVNSDLTLRFSNVDSLEITANLIDNGVVYQVQKSIHGDSALFMASEMNRRSDCFIHATAYNSSDTIINRTVIHRRYITTRYFRIKVY